MQNSNIFSKNKIFETIILSKTFKQQIIQQIDKFDRKNTLIINYVLYSRSHQNSIKMRRISTKNIKVFLQYKKNTTNKKDFVQ